MPHSNWQQANAAFPDRSTAGHLFATQVGPVLRQAEADGTIAAWFFLRKEQWRLRWLAVSPAACDTFLNALASATPSLRWTSVVCELEPHAFGGNAAMTTACELFHADSRRLLDRLQDSHHPLGQRETSILLCSTLLRGAGLDWFEQGDVWARVSALRPSQPTFRAGHLEGLHHAMRTLMSADTHVLCDPAQPGPLSGYHEWITAFDDAGQSLARLHRDGLLTRGLRAVLVHHLIFHFNRAGLTGTEQATMAALGCDTVFHDQPTGTRNLMGNGWPA
jgi:thiopeptide-type bacteriocin biosynthesis protein